MVLENSEYITNHTGFSGYRHATKEYSTNITRMHVYYGDPDRHARHSQSLLGSRPQHWLRFPLQEPIVIRKQLLVQAQLVILNMLTICLRFNLQLTIQPTTSTISTSTKTLTTVPTLPPIWLTPSQ